MSAETPLRQRPAASTAQKVPVRKPDMKSKPTSEERSEPRFSLIEALRIVFALLILFGGLSWFITGDSLIWDWRKWPTLLGTAKRYITGPIYLTDDQLALYNGTNTNIPIYVGLNGSIYDVSASRHTYSPGGSYSFFSGRDATRAFVTGCFAEDLTPDLRGVEEMFIPLDDPEEEITKGEKKTRRERDVRLARKSIKDTVGHWAKVFNGETGKPYFHVGEIVREEGWLEKLPRRELCEAAREGRTKREDAAQRKSNGNPYQPT